MTFACQGEELIGVVARPAFSNVMLPGQVTVGLVIVVGGPQYRAGSHRQFVLLARMLAAHGVPVLRFDYRGMGDSTGEQREFEDVNDDVAAAITTLTRVVPSITNVALWGLCDGASAALLYCQATQDIRVKGLCLLNPWVRSEASLAKTYVKHYYTERLLQREFWLKLLGGKVAASAAIDLVRHVKSALGRQVASMRDSASNHPYQIRMALGLSQFKGQVLLILSGDDYVAKEFLEYSMKDDAWKCCFQLSNLARHDILGGDHTFSSASARIQTESLTLDWLSRLQGLSLAHIQPTK